VNTYEGLFIFSDTLKEDELKEVQDRALAEIERQGGKLLGAKKLGRRSFARPMSKRDSGIYLRAVFELAPGSITPLLARYRLSEDVFRIQITRGDEKSMSMVSEPPAAEPAEAEAAPAETAPAGDS
jgi:ribosomal protein S6